MSLVVLANNWLGWRAVDWLRREGDELTALVVPPPPRRRFGDALLRAAGLPPERVFDGSRLREPATLAALRALAPRRGLSVLFDEIVRREFLDLFPDGVYNLHPAWLPFNRGRWSNVWAIVERTRAGVSLHRIDEGVDTGSVVARAEVEVEPIDTGLTLYRKLERAGLELLRESWPAIRRGEAREKAQDDSLATTHRLRDGAALDRIDLDRSYSARELIDLLRARTFPPHRGAFFEAGGRRVYLQLRLDYE